MIYYYLLAGAGAAGIMIDNNIGTTTTTSSSSSSNDNNNNNNNNNEEEEEQHHYDYYTYDDINIIKNYVTIPTTHTHTHTTQTTHTNNYDDSSMNDMSMNMNDMNDMNMNMNMNNMKLRKEEFVTGHDGSIYPFEILWICSSVVWGCWLYMEIMNSTMKKRVSPTRTRTLCGSILIESIIIWLPMVIVQTNYLYPYGSAIMILQIISASILYVLRRRLRRRRRRRRERGGDADNDENENENENESESEFNIIRDPVNGRLRPVKNPSYRHGINNNNNRKKDKNGNNNEDDEDDDEFEFDIIRGSNGRLETVRKEKTTQTQTQTQTHTPSTPNTNTNTSNNNNNNNNNLNNLDYLTLYRSTIYYLTFVAILAVDFELFPRKLCKTEISGYGLMDVGAASFVISSGIVNGKSYIVNYSKNKKVTTASYSWYTLLKPLRNATPLIIIGIIRCILNKEIDYQEHVTEYGVQWNFFFTLGILAIVPIIRKQLILSLDSKILKFLLVLLPFITMIVYQFLLTQYGLQEFIISSPRRSLIKTNTLLYEFYIGNREGILGCIGYIFLHSFGELIGQYYVFNNNNNNSNNNNKSNSNGSSLGFITVLLWIVHFGIEYIFNFSVSRRSTNISFCFWALAHNITLLWSLQKITLIIASKQKGNNCSIPIGMKLINKHGMISFLIANILTGLVNLTLPTIDIADNIAIWIVFSYICAVSCVVILFDKLLLSYRSTKATMKNEGGGNKDTTTSKIIVEEKKKTL